MPTYTFINKENGDEWTERMTIADRDYFLEENPHIEQKIVAIATVDSWGISGGARPPADFQKYVLGKVRDNVPGAERSQFERRWKIPKEI